MQFLEFIYFIVNIIFFVNRKKIFKPEGNPSIAEIIKSRKQKKITAMPVN